MVELSVVSSRAVLSAVLIPIFAHSCDSYSPLATTTTIVYRVAYVLLVSPLGTTGRMFYLCYFSQNQQMDGLYVFYEQFGVWCNFSIP